MQRSFGEQLKTIRKQRGMVQKELGDATGVGQATIANYEKGIRFPGEDTLRKLTEVLDVSLDYLFGIPTGDRGSQSMAGFVLDESYSEEELISLLLNEPVDVVHNYIENHMEDGRTNADHVYRRILVPLLHTTGQLWETGRVSVAQEHIISDKVRQLIAIFGEVDRSTRLNEPVYTGTWLGFSAPGDGHDMAMLMLSRMMETRGWQTVFLGVGPPLPDLEQAVEEYLPDVVAASLTIPGHWNSLEIYIRSLLPRMKPGARMIIGGAGLAHFRNEVESMGILVADDLDQAALLAEQDPESR